MIEELTPRVLMSMMILVIVVVPTLTLLLSTVLLYRYRRAVRRAMDVTSGFHDPTLVRETAINSRPVDDVVTERNGKSDAGDVCRGVFRTPWRNALRYLIAGLVFALVMALAAHQVYPSSLGVPGFGVPGFLIAVWIYLWPAFLAMALIMPGHWWRWALGFLGYCAVYGLLSLWASTNLNLPEYRFGAAVVPARSTVTPEAMIRMWLAVDGVPTLLMLLCFNRWLRAISTLVLALVTAAISGLMAVYLALFSPRGVDVAVAVATGLNIPIQWLLLTIFLGSLIGFGALGWVLVRWIARAYQRGRLSDQSLLLDALWVLFASTYSMWLVRGGVAWVATGPLAFVAFKLSWWLAAGLSTRALQRPVGLTFLRVFSLGRRSEALLEGVAKYWRHVGSIQLITGPDLATSTVQPHQFLDFLGGKLTHHFVGDRTSLERSLAERDGGANPDGRFRINNFFCHADSWKAVLPRLVKEGDAVLMDLRSFKAENAGCTHELRHLVAKVPFRRCLLVVDSTTSQGFLDEILASASADLQPGSPNFARPLEELRRFSIGSGTAETRALVQRLVETTDA